MDSKFSVFQRLLILKIIRQDRVSLGVDKFIVDRFKGNTHFVEVIYLKPEWLLSQANEKIPIIYILSQGADPSQQIREMAKTYGFIGKKFMSLSLGQNMEKTAENMVLTGSQRGYWVLL
jgi:dynein heavy chain